MEFKKLKLSLLFLILTITLGTLGYHFVEGMDFFDALYMTTITISTVGFGEIKPLSTIGRMMTIVIIITGVAILAYTTSTLLQLVIDGEFAKNMGRKKLNKLLDRLDDHYIICGYGRIGSLIANELYENNKPFVIIESDPEIIKKLENRRIPFIPLDATSEEALVIAGIMKAKGLITAVKSDADNVFIALTARGLNPNIYILSRASDENTEKTLIRAGANKVILPYVIGGKRMAHVLLRPTVTEFFDVTMTDKQLGLVMEESIVSPKSKLIGKNLIESNLRKDFGVIIVAIKKGNGKMIFNPSPTEILDENDVIVVLGKKDDVSKMNEII